MCVWGGVACFAANTQLFGGVSTPLHPVQKLLKEGRRPLYSHTYNSDGACKLIAFINIFVNVWLPFITQEGLLIDVTVVLSKPHQKL